MLHPLVLEELGEGAEHLLDAVLHLAILHVVKLVQAVAEVVVGLAGHLHVPQGEVQPAQAGKGLLQFSA